MQQESIIVYTSPWQKSFYEDPAGTIGMLAPIIPWFLTALTIMVAFWAIDKLDMWLWRNRGNLDDYHKWIVRGCYLLACPIIYCVYRFSHLYVWGY